MDDNLELPTAAPKTEESQDQEEEQLSGDEDQGPDWTRIPGLSVARPVIPKRGEKDFEPTAQGGSGLQRHVLDRSRSAMLEALKTTRTISYKSVSHAIWHPQLKRAHVTVARGILFTTMGYSAARATEHPTDTRKIQRRLELLPEEALYLVERGAMYCWKAATFPVRSTSLLDDMEGVPMSVQQAYGEMIGTEDLTFEKYQVYAYLRRLGFIVTRANPPSAHYPMAPPPVPLAPLSIMSRLYSTMASLVFRLVCLCTGARNWWMPLRFSQSLHHDMTYPSLFKLLRYLPSGYDVQLHVKHPQQSPPSPYQIFYNIYKPSTPFRKTAPPSPDFYIVVVNARSTPMPTISELSTLFEQLPELPPPAPRKRMSFAQQKQAATATAQQPKQHATQSPPVHSSFIQRCLSWIWSLPPTHETKTNSRPANPFLSLKTGKKMVVVAAVDAGTISFFRFGQGVFTDWPMS